MTHEEAMGAHLHYALNLLDDEDQWQYEQHISSCDKCERTYRDYVADGDWERKIKLTVPEDIIKRLYASYTHVG